MRRNRSESKIRSKIRTMTRTMTRIDGLGVGLGLATIVLDGRLVELIGMTELVWLDVEHIPVTSAAICEFKHALPRPTSTP